MRIIDARPDQYGLDRFYEQYGSKQTPGLRPSTDARPAGLIATPSVVKLGVSQPQQAEAATSDKPTTQPDVNDNRLTTHTNLYVPTAREGIILPDQPAYLREKEIELARKVRSYGSDQLGVPLPLDLQGLQFVYNLNRFALLQLLITSADRSRRAFVYGSVTPDTKNGVLQLVGLFATDGSNIHVPDAVSPLVARQNRLKLDPNGVPSDVNMYLTAANQLTQTGRHDTGHAISPLEPRHAITALGGIYYQGDRMPAAQIFNPKGAPDHVRDHTGDRLEDRKGPKSASSHKEQERASGLLPAVSARSVGEVKASLVQVPFTFLPPYNLATIQRGIGDVMVILTRELVEQTELANGRVVPKRTNDSDGLATVMRSGFVALAEMGIQEDFKRNVDRQLEQNARYGGNH